MTAMGLKSFFARAPDRAVAGTIDNAEFYDLVLQQPQGPACASFGRLGTGQGNHLASFSPSKIRSTAGIARGLRLNTASKPSSTSCLRVACAREDPGTLIGPGSLSVAMPADACATARSRTGSCIWAA